MDFVKQQMKSTDNSHSPGGEGAAAAVAKSLLFPYSEGLSFEQDVWMDKGQAAAFAGALDLAADFELGDHEPARIRRAKAHGDDSAPARHSSDG